MGIVHIEVAPAARRKGHATYLLGEALRQLRIQGVTQVEALISEQNVPANRLLTKLGFEQSDVVSVLSKTC